MEPKEPLTRKQKGRVNLELQIIKRSLVGSSYDDKPPLFDEELVTLYNSDGTSFQFYTE